MKTILFFGIMQIAFIQGFAQGHGREHDHNNNYGNRGRNEHDHNNYHNNGGWGNHHERDVVIHHDYGYRHYDNHIAFRPNYGYHYTYRPAVHFRYRPFYHTAWLPLINLSFGSSYQYGYTYQSDFERVLIAIDHQAYDDSKIIVAKQALENRSLTSDQVLTIMKSFEYDNTRLEFAELAYEHVVDPQNFYTVNSAFAYTSSVDDLNKFLESQTDTH